MNGLRGIAILMVLLGHGLAPLSKSPNTPLQFIGEIAKVGWAGVVLFFVLSGFLITRILLSCNESKTYFQHFYMRRVLRIFPLYYGVSLAVYLVFLFSRGSFTLETSTQSPWVVLFFAQNFVMASYGSWLYDYPWGNLSHFWSLAVEEHYYWIWPFAIRYLKKESLVRVCAWLILIALFSRCLLVFKYSSSFAAFVLSPCRMDSLIIGSLIAVYFNSKSLWSTLQRQIIWITPVSGVLLILLFIHQGGMDHSNNGMRSYGLTLFSICFGCFLVEVLKDRHSMLKHLCQMTFLRFFGKYSYALYVFEWFLNPYFKDQWFFGQSFIGIILMVVSKLTILSIVSMLSWHVCEKHFLKLKIHYPY